MIAFQLARLRSLQVDHLVVATTTLERDNPLVEVAAKSGVDVLRGSEADVLGRVLAALDAFPAELIVRLTADCPLADPAIVQDAIALLRMSNADYASNSLVRTFPVGLDAEVITAEALRAAAADARDAVEREHVTPFIQRHPERFSLAALRVPDLLGNERWTVDTPDDLERVREIVASLAHPREAGWRDVLAVAGVRAIPHTGELHLRPALQEDDEVLVSTVGERFGTREPPLPLAQHFLDPSVRTWIGTIGGKTAGWVQVRVLSGVGRVTGRVVVEWNQAMLAGLRRVLKADFQIREPVGVAWPATWRDVV